MPTVIKTAYLYRWYILEPLLKGDKIWDNTLLMLLHIFLRGD